MTKKSHIKSRNNDNNNTTNTTNNNNNIQQYQKNDDSSVKKALEESDSFIKEISKSLPQNPDRGIFWDIVCSIFEPGVNAGLMAAIHFSFWTLFAVHIWLLWITEGSAGHVWGLIALNVILYPCLLAFISMAYKNEKKQ